MIMKKVLFYIHSLNKGGAERVLITIADKLSRLGKYEVVIMTDVIDDLEYALPMGIKRINLKDFMRSDSAVDRIMAIRRCVREQAPDSFIVFMLSGAIRAVVATMFTRYKAVACVRSNPYDDYSRGKNRAILMWTMSMAKYIVCQTQFQVDFFPERLKKKCVIISNPIFDEFVKKAKEINDASTYSDYENNGKPREIVATGRLYDYKNHMLLIDAFSEIADEYRDINVVIYGEGPYRDTLEKAIKAHGLEERVLLPGDSDQVSDDIAGAYIYVLPSDTEGLPNALMEAMALGLPVIATDCPCGGPRSLIENGKNGMLVPVGDVSAMRDALRYLIENEDIRKKVGKNAKRILVTNDIEGILERWEEII